MKNNDKKIYLLKYVQSDYKYTVSARSKLIDITIDELVKQPEIIEKMGYNAKVFLLTSFVNNPQKNALYNDFGR